MAYCRQQFSLVYNNLFVFLEPVDEPWPTYACGQFMQGSSNSIADTRHYLDQCLFGNSLCFGNIRHFVNYCVNRFSQCREITSPIVHFYFVGDLPQIKCEAHHSHIFFTFGIYYAWGSAVYLFVCL